MEIIFFLNFKCFNSHLTTYVIISKLFQPLKLAQNNFSDTARLKIFEICNKTLKSFWNNFGQNYFSWDIAQLIFCCIVISIFDIISLLYWFCAMVTCETRSSANAEEPCEHTVIWNHVKCCTSVRQIAFGNVCNRWMTLKVIQGQCHCCHLIGHIQFPISLSL